MKKIKKGYVNFGGWGKETWENWQEVEILSSKNRERKDDVVEKSYLIKNKDGRIIEKFDVYEL